MDFGYGTPSLNQQCIFFIISGIFTPIEGKYLCSGILKYLFVLGPRLKDSLSFVASPAHKKLLKDFYFSNDFKSPKNAHFLICVSIHIFQRFQL